ncbi:hypothetical protein, partial [Wolbachia pipientis]|uniref:hypothetical protein n=1 Tax=Wolbachia pipientis TaxID=955 RepID=UPI001C9DB50B
FVIEPAGQKQVLSHKYPCYHNKGAGEACQASFLFLLNDSCDLCKKSIDFERTLAYTISIS